MYSNTLNGENCNCREEVRQKMYYLSPKKINSTDVPYKIKAKRKVCDGKETRDSLWDCNTQVNKINTALNKQYSNSSK